LQGYQELHLKIVVAESTKHLNPMFDILMHKGFILPFAVKRNAKDKRAGVAKKFTT
jgi:hypothetical protein